MGIRSTIVVFGSSRVLTANPSGGANSQTNPQTALHPHWGRWYGEARRFARIVAQRGGSLSAAADSRDNVIATGGGPGLMAAANRGAFEVGAPSIGFNIQLPDVQEPNPYTTPELTFQFRSFAIRQMHLAMRANALRGGVSRRGRHVGRTVRDTHPCTNKEDAPDPNCLL